jgi:hypothetical protein
MTIILLIHAANLPIDVLDYTLDGPSTATVGLASDQFVVELGEGTLASPDTVTPDDGGAGGAFSVVSVILTDWGRIASFTYTPAAAGAVTISVTDSGGLTDPPPIILTVSELVVVDEDITHGPIVMLHPAGMPAGTWSRWEGGPR